jgi:tripartite-type tricarboxylate transporter receptor subunit TctC
MTHTTRRAALGATLAALALPARAQAPAWRPTRPMRFVVAAAPGGAADIIARMTAEAIGPRLGQSVIIENRPGAGGNIGTDQALKAEPDGHSIALVTVGTGAINHALYRNMPYRPEDLAAISCICTMPNVIMVANRVPATTLAELVALVRREPGKYNFGSSGIGTSLHLTGEMLKNGHGLDLTHVPFRGAAQMLMEAAAGRVEIIVDNLPSAIPQIRDGRVRALAVTDTRRAASLPEVPTTVEAGFPDIQAVAWFGLITGARAPRAAIERIAAETAAAVRDPAFRAKLAEQGAEPVGSGPDDFADFMRAETAKWGEVVRRSNARAD